MNAEQIRFQCKLIEGAVQRLQQQLIHTAADKEQLAVRLQVMQTELVEAAGRLNGVRVQLGLLAEADVEKLTDHLHDALTDAAWVRLPPKPTFDFKPWLDVAKKR